MAGAASQGRGLSHGRWSVKPRVHPAALQARCGRQGGGGRGRSKASELCRPAGYSCLCGCSCRERGKAALSTCRSPASVSLANHAGLPSVPPPRWRSVCSRSTTFWSFLLYLPLPREPLGHWCEKPPECTQAKLVKPL